MTTAAVQPVPTGGRDVPMSDSGLRGEHEHVLHVPKFEERDEKPRGRRRSRPQHIEKVNSGASAPDAEKEQSSGEEGEDGPDGPRKRRRSRKGLDKKFPCKDCEKSYSRAEHLYRHQLNHTRKQIYTCDIGDCTRQFVRQDLCNRHRERHTAPGSQLQRKDAMQNNVSLANPATNMASRGSLSPELTRADSTTARGGQILFSPPGDNGSNSFSPIGPPPPSSFSRSGSISQPVDSNGYQQANSYRRSHSDQAIQSTPSGNSSQSFVKAGLPQRHGSFSTIGDKATDSIYERTPQQHILSSFAANPQTSQQHAYGNFQGSIGGSQIPIPAPYVNDQGFTPFSLPPSSFSPGPITTSSAHGFQASYSMSSPQTTMASDYQDRDFGQQSGPEMMYLDQMGATETMPVFGNESFENQRSPFAIADNFVAYIFNAQQYNIPQGQAAPQSIMNSYNDAQNQYQPYLANELNLGGYFPQNQQHPMAVTSLLDPPTPDMILSDEKSQEVVDLIKNRFNETDHDAIPRQKESILEGDRSNDSHVLSRMMMQTYIEAFWRHFHPQLPILHKPTFSPDKTPNLLLIAMMAIGASLLGSRDHDFHLTQSCAELANFLAWHLRWKLFMHSQFGPPGKLWVFQSLLLLEIYEKMYSTRALHERAHIHHATTITNMRRGSSLIGRSALDSPPSVRDGKHGINGSRQSSASGANTPDEWWNHWITNEATHRAAWAAFVIDSVHATMFGHSTVMVAHEMRLQLPCDEALWSATNGAEVGKMEASLHANGIKRLSLMEGLKRTLDRQEVPTNAFGRTILMAGLLSVRWHMNQRDLQLNSLGPHTLGGLHKWRGPLTRAFDFWKNDFDLALASTRATNSGPYTWSSNSKQDEEIVFESRTVLHHLAHMAMHVDIIECQIFARAKRLLGRNIGQKDLRDITRNMKDRWAPTAKARDATFYALQFLCTVLNPEDHSGNNLGYDSPIYSAREDVLMNKSWVLYFAALTVWCYAFALEGPSHTHLPSDNPKEQVRSMRVYLHRMGKIKTPEDLKLVTGFNECAGMLQVLQLTFADTRWELLHEAAKLLTNCVMLIGGQMQ